MFELFETCRVFLNIEKPIHLDIRPRIWKGSAGVHWVMLFDNKKIKNHVIKISYNGLCEERDFNTVLAHEFVHAWQMEHKPWKKNAHNKTFANKAKELETFLIGEGFKVKDIFNPDIDKE
jgi:hypothetical protein